MSTVYEFLNSNSLRAYPLKEGSTAKSEDGLFTIPESLIVDAAISASSSVLDSFYISRVDNRVDSIIIHISRKDTAEFVGNFIIQTSSHTPNKTYYLHPSDEFPQAAGRISVGVLTDTQAAFTGSFTFDQTATEFEMRTIVPSQAGITKIKFENVDTDLVTLTGDVTIQARVNQEFKEDDGKVILDAANGLGLNQDCGEELRYIKTINGILPDENGNFSLYFDECSGLEEEAGGLILRDICCKPCTGCNEIESLTDNVRRLEDELLELRDFYVNLRTNFDNFRTVFTTSCECE